MYLINARARSAYLKLSWFRFTAFQRHLGRPPWERPESSRRATAMALVTSGLVSGDGAETGDYNVYELIDVDGN